MLVQVITSWPELIRHEDEWWALLGRSATNEPTLSPLWLDAWWQVFGDVDGRSLRAVLVREAGRLIGLAPLAARRVHHRGAIPLRRIELLATGEPPEDEICSDYLNVLCERRAERPVARAVVEALVRGSLGAWDELVLDVMHGQAVMTGCVVSQLRRHGLRVEVRPRRPCPYTLLPRAWADYLAMLPSRHRSMIRRSVRDLESWASGDIELGAAESAAELAEGQGILIDLHGQRWSEAGSAGVFASPRFLAFHRRVMPALLERGHLDLLWLRCKGEPVAAIYNILWNGKVYFYQCGRRTDLPGRLRPGIAMHAYAMQRAIARGMTAYDFLSGSSQYKQQLATTEEPLVRVCARRPGSLPVLGHHLLDGAAALARTAQARLRRRQATPGSTG